MNDFSRQSAPVGQLLGSEQLPGLLSAAEVCQILEISGRTLLRYEQRGLLHPLRFSMRMKRYRIEDISAFIDKAILPTFALNPYSALKRL